MFWHVFVCLFVIEIVQLGFLLMVILLLKMAMVIMNMHDIIYYLKDHYDHIEQNSHSVIFLKRLSKQEKTIWKPWKNVLKTWYIFQNQSMFFLLKKGKVTRRQWGSVLGRQWGAFERKWSFWTRGHASSLDPRLFSIPHFL